MFELTVTPKQAAFLHAPQDEVLFGGAAGGGKSHAQLVDSLRFALQYPQSRQLVLRRTFPELERSLVPASLSLFPPDAARFLSARRTWRFANGSSIEFGHCAAEQDVTQYQSAEYDVVRFDELTHFTEFQYLYLLSRVRGTNGYPKQLKSTTNPGGVGHDWVKRRFIDPRPPGSPGFDACGRSLLFLPARISDNPFLSRADPGYVRRLSSLPDPQRRALLDGDWDLTRGRFFPEFDRAVHLLPPFLPPAHWRRYRSIDYGLDMLACYWTAFDPLGRGIVYRELYEPGLIVSAAARKILAMTPPNEFIEQTLAPPDLWGRSADTGKSQAELFAQSGVLLSRVSARRESGWLNLREWLAPFTGEDGVPTAGLRVTVDCVHLIRTLSAITADERNPNDCAIHPHECTHAPDAIRYLLSGRPFAAPLSCEDEDFTGYERFLAFGV